jgi:hypothetical protein
VAAREVMGVVERRREQRLGLWLGSGRVRRLIGTGCLGLRLLFFTGARLVVGRVGGLLPFRGIGVLRVHASILPFGGSPALLGKTLSGP